MQEKLGLIYGFLNIGPIFEPRLKAVSLHPGTAG